MEKTQTPTNATTRELHALCVKFLRTGLSHAIRNHQFIACFAILRLGIGLAIDL
jgi:hypothetical protein